MSKYINIGLLAVIALLILGTHANNPNLPQPLKALAQTASQIISGNGTPTSMAQFTGSYTLGNSQIYQSGNNISIGDQNPAGAKLKVTGQIYTTAGGIKFPDNTIQTTAAGAAGANLWTSVGTLLRPAGALWTLQTPDGAPIRPAYSFITDSGTGMYRPVTNTIGFTTGGVERMRIENTGIEVLGKIDAAGKIEVANKIKVDDIRNTFAAVDTSGNFTWTRVVTNTWNGASFKDWDYVTLDSTRPVLGIQAALSGGGGTYACIVSISNYFTGLVGINAIRVNDLDIGGAWDVSWPRTPTPEQSNTWIFENLLPGRYLAGTNSAYNKPAGLIYIPPGKTLAYDQVSRSATNNTCAIDVLYGNAF